MKKKYLWFSAVSCIFVKCSFQFFILLNKNIPIKIKDMHTKCHHTYRTHWDKLIINGGKWGFILFLPKYSINKILLNHIRVTYCMKPDRIRITSRDKQTVHLQSNIVLLGLKKAFDLLNINNRGPFYRVEVSTM